MAYLLCEESKGLAWNLIVKFKNLTTMPVKKGNKSSDSSKLSNLNVETLNDDELAHIKGGSTSGVITMMQPD
jgi:bacteriocin-like protein